MFLGYHAVACVISAEGPPFSRNGNDSDVMSGLVEQ